MVFFVEDCCVVSWIAMGKQRERLLWVGDESMSNDKEV